MKLPLTIILFILLNGCLGQYPQLHYVPKMTVVKDYGSHWLTKPGNDTIFVTLKTYIGDSLVYFVAPYVDTLYSYKYWDSILSQAKKYPSTAFTHAREEKEFEKYDAGFIYIPINQNPDTVYFYWKKYLFYRHQSDKQKDIIKKSQSRKPPQWVINLNKKEYDRLMDSVVMYKKLIDKLSK